MSGSTISMDDVLEEFEGRVPERGPYSFSRLHGCDYEFQQTYIEDEQETQLTRWGRSEGSAMHELVEREVPIYIERDRDEWPSVEASVHQFLDDHPEYNDFRSEMERSLRRVRNNFDVNPNTYVGSEEKLGTGLRFDRHIGFDDEACWYRGIVDYIEVDDAGVARIVDFKNRPSPHKWRKLRTAQSDISRQLLGYTALAMAAYPSIRAATFEVFYFQTGQSRYLHERDESGEYQRRYFQREEIQRMVVSELQRKMIARERQSRFEPQPSRRRCQFCGVFDQCPKWDDYDWAREFAIRSEQEAQEALEQLVVLKEARNRIDDALKSWVKEQGGVETESGAHYQYSERERVRPKTYDFLSTLAEHYNLDDDNVEAFLERLRGELTLTKGSSTSLADSLPDEVQDELYERGFTRRRSVRKDKSF
ncbi:MAG: hypothetical protein ABEN55_02545 [Bradymonadaceae bacterium]